MQSRAILVTGLVLISAVFLWGCGSEGSGDSVEEPVPERTEKEPAVAVSGGLDYNPIRDMTELVGQSRLVVRGEIVDLGEGRTTRSWYSEDGYDDLRSVVVTIEPGQIEQGELPGGSDGKVYLELAHFGFTHGRVDDLESLRGREAVVYLVKAQQRGTVGDEEILDPEAGRPEGQPLFQMAHPQGFHIETTDGAGAWDVGEGRAFVSGTTLDDLSSLSGGRFPEYQPWEE